MEFKDWLLQLRKEPRLRPSDFSLLSSCSCQVSWSQANCDTSSKTRCSQLGIRCGPVGRPLMRASGQY
jgi:hypothetical protein